MNLLALFIGSFTITLSGAMMPGPLLTLTIANSAQKGFWEGPLLVSGHGILELILVIAITLGISPALKTPMFIFWITLVGGIVLIYMGYDMVKNANKLSLIPTAHMQTKSFLNKSSIISGAIVSIANPYWILWWATIGLGYLTSSLKYGLLGIVIFFIGHILADLVWYSLISFGIGKGKNLIKDNTYHLIIKFCGIFLIGFGSWFLYGLKKLI